jgi:DMSO/TMAO reductase YedYZ molybdopterin-dependent catalytic subunit
MPREKSMGRFHVGPHGVVLGVALLAMAILNFGAMAQTPQAASPAAVASDTLVVRGAVKQELKLSAADLKAMARVHVTAKDHDGAAHDYEGVALQTVLAKAGAPQGGDLRGKSMSLTVLAEASDGYSAVFSLAELDEDFAHEQVIVADLVDGKPLAPGQGPLRLVVPGDKRQGRWVRLLQSITVVRAGVAQ